MRAQPFSYASLPAISREEIRTAARLRDAGARFVRSEAVAAALTELAGETVSLQVRRTRSLEAARVPADGVGIAIAPADTRTMANAALIDVELPLASNLVARALRQRVPRITDASRAPSPEISGALAALLITALRRAHAGVALRVVAAGPAAALARDLAAIHARVATAWLTVIVGADAFDARVSVPLHDLPPPNEHRPLSASALARMGDAPLALPLVAATCVAGRLTLSSLRRGDAFVLPSFALRMSQGGALVGPVSLVAPRAERGIAADLGEAGRLVLRSGHLESHPWTYDPLPPLGASMSDEPSPTLEVLEDAPVVVRVELGSVQMKAREWAELAPGDVITLGRKLGDPASLRVGGVEVARGELVQVDGEYGVRILGRGPGSGGEH